MKNCDVIRDLMPLSVDGCCSSDSEELVRDHISQCKECREIFESMKKDGGFSEIALPEGKVSHINVWRASVLQSALLFISFGIITAGVAAEAKIPSGLMNGNLAYGIVVPVTAFLLSLANWSFVRQYKSRRAFSRASMLLTLLFAVCGDVFTAVHYEFGLFSLLTDSGISGTDIFEMLISPLLPFGVNIFMTAAVCLVSRLISDRYAGLVGKE